MKQCVTCRDFLLHKNLSRLTTPSPVTRTYASGKSGGCFINITQYDHVMTQNEKEKRTPSQKMKFNLSQPSAVETEIVYACTEPSGVRSGFGLKAIIIFERWKRVQSGKNVNLNPSTHKDEKMPPIRWSVNRNPLTKWGVRTRVENPKPIVSLFSWNKFSLNLKWWRMLLSSWTKSKKATWINLHQPSVRVSCWNVYAESKAAYSSWVPCRWFMVHDSSTDSTR